MVPLLLGWNEPDIQGRCLNDPSIVKPSDGYCAMAGSMGWWCGSHPVRHVWRCAVSCS